MIDVVSTTAPIPAAPAARTPPKLSVVVSWYALTITALPFSASLLIKELSIFASVVSSIMVTATLAPTPTMPMAPVTAKTSTFSVHSATTASPLTVPFAGSQFMTGDATPLPFACTVEVVMEAQVSFSRKLTTTVPPIPAAAPPAIVPPYVFVVL